MRKIIITGVTGQLGSYLADYLLANTDLEIIGAVRRISVDNYDNINHIRDPRFRLAEMDLSDSYSITNLIEKEKPDYFINAAANSFVGSSWNCPVQHLEFNTIGVLHQLEAIRKFSPQTRYINLGSSEEFGDVVYSPQDEKHPIRPRSPYGCSKAAARNIVKVWRESYKLYAIQAYVFNMESPRRGREFVTRKITLGVARISNEIKTGGKITAIVLGNLDSRRDWQHCEDVCCGIWKMLNQDLYNPTIITGYDNSIPHGKAGGSERVLSQVDKNARLSKCIKEYILASGTTRTIREFVEKAFAAASIEIINSNPNRIEPSKGNKGLQVNYMYRGSPIVVSSRDFYRPAEVNLLQGDSSLIRKELGWEPKISFDSLVKSMIESDINGRESI